MTEGPVVGLCRGSGDRGAQWPLRYQKLQPGQPLRGTGANEPSMCVGLHPHPPGTGVLTQCLKTRCPGRPACPVSCARSLEPHWRHSRPSAAPLP